LFLGLLAMEPLALFLEDLEATDFFGGHITPRDVEMGRVEFQLKDTLKEAAGDRVRPGVIEVIEPATRATVDGEPERAAMRAGARRVGIVHRALVPTLLAPYVVGVWAAARAVRAAVAQILGVDGPIDEQPEGDRMRPLIRP
jgi:hypothetical protein